MEGYPYGKEPSGGKLPSLPPLALFGTPCTPTHTHICLSVAGGLCVPIPLARCRRELIEIPGTEGVWQLGLWVRGANVPL